MAPYRGRDGILCQAELALMAWRARGAVGAGGIDGTSSCFSTGRPASPAGAQSNHKSLSSRVADHCGLLTSGTTDRDSRRGRLSTSGSRRCGTRAVQKKAVLGVWG